MRLLRPVLPLLLLTVTAVRGQVSVSGSVRDESGATLPGVSVRPRYAGGGTVTNGEGRYQLTVPSDTTTLVFSFVGMTPQTQRPAGRATLDVTLRAQNQLLDEVVVSGYGLTTNPRDAVGSYAQVEAKALRADRPIESFDRMLTGLVAGVQVQTNTGEPGVPVRVRIRGENTLPQLGGGLSASGEPLYVLDGVPLYDIQEQQVNRPGLQAGNLTEQRLNPLAGLNPNDIETITVLKDAAAATLYGANAANGVVLITTKRGRSGQNRVEASTHYGVATLLTPPRLLETPRYLELYGEALRGDGYPADSVTLLVAQAGDPDVTTRWSDLVVRPATNATANLSLSGGGGTTSFRFAAGYQQQQATSKGNDFRRLSFRTSVDHRLNDHFKVTFNLGAAHTTKQGFDLLGAVDLPPVLSPYAPDGTFNNEGLLRNRPNPLAVLAQNENENRGLSATGNVDLEYYLHPTLSVRTTFGTDYYQNRRTVYESALNASGANANGFGSRFDRNNLRWINFTQLRWQRGFGHHQLAALAGYEAQEKTTFLLRLSASDFLFEELREIGFQDGENIDGASSQQQEAVLSYYTQLNYNYRSRYYVSASLRQDASSVFGADRQVARFGSMGLSWVASDEGWLADVAALDLLKLRASVGTTGNARIGSYASRGLYRFGVAYAGQGGSQPSAGPNPDLGWELNLKTNLGLDLALWQRVRLTVEHYRNYTYGAITQVQVARETGFNDAPANASDLRNTGWEFTLNTINTRAAGGAVGWTTQLNLAFNRNVVTRLYLEQPQFSAADALVIRAGSDVSSLYVVPYAGVDPYNGKPLYRLADGNLTDDQLRAGRPENLRVVGRRSPDFFGGITNALTWKNVTLSALITYQYGASLLVPTRFTNLNSDGRNLLLVNQDVNQLDRWQQPGDVTDVPRLRRGVRTRTLASFHRSTRFVYDNSYLRFDNVSLSYRLPQGWVGRVRAAAATLTAQANLLGYLNLSRRRAGRNGINEYRNVFPESRTFAGGINVRF